MALKAKPLPLLAATGCVLTVLLFVDGCSKKPTIITGKMLLAESESLNDCCILAMLDGQEIARSPIDPQSGKFVLDLPDGGTYSFMLHRSGVTIEVGSPLTIKKGEEILADPFVTPRGFLDAPPESSAASDQQQADDTPVRTGILRGRIHPNNAVIKFIVDGQVLLQGEASGSFINLEVPVGTYDLEFSATGFYPQVQKGVTIGTGGSRELDVFLLFYSGLDGVDWDNNTVRADGKGFGNPNLPVKDSAASACNAARSAAQRNLADKLVLIQVEPGKFITNVAGESVKFKVAGAVQNYAKTVSQTRNSDGSCEIVLEYPLRGKNSFTSFVQKIMGRQD